MYLPPHFEESRLPVLHDLIRQHSFGTLVTVQDGVPVATHLPFLLDPGRGAFGTLWGHIARPNQQWRGFGRDEALVIFQGPHAYVSPTWYTTAPAVPTWNYLAVHAYGAPRIVDHPAEVQRGLDRLVAAYEGGGEGGYRPDWALAFTANLAKGIVAFEIPITRLEGKYKLSQNRPAGDQHAVAARLAASADPTARAVGEVMQRRLGGDQDPGERRV